MTTIIRTIKKLKDGISGLLTNVAVDNVSDLYGKLEESLATLQQKAQLPEAMTSTLITLYDGVVNYPAVTPLFGSTVKDIRPVGQFRQSGDMVYKHGGEDFDLQKGYGPISGYNLAFETENGVNIMRIKTRFTPHRVVVDPMNATTGWTIGGTASLLAQDTSFYYMSPASLRFTLTGIGSGYLEKTLQSAIDMTPYKNVGMGFLELELPVLNLSSVNIRIGSDSANYYTVSATQGNLGAWTVGDFLDTPLDLSQATTTGAPDITKIKYVRLTFTTIATITNIRCGYLSFSLPSQHKVMFSTNGIFKATDGSINNFITDDDDIILLGDSPYNLYKHECAMTVGFGEGGTLAGGILGTINSKLNGARSRTGQIIQLGLYDIYRANNPSGDVRETGNWYL